MFCLVATWHDTESIAIHRLHSSGHLVVDRRVSTDTLTVNHGGVAVTMAASRRCEAGCPTYVRRFGPCPTSFEVTAARATVGAKSYTLVVNYRPGSVDVTQTFFDELSDLLDRVITTNDTLFIVGDLNIHLERSADVHAQRLRDLLGCYDIVLRYRHS